MTGVTMYRCRLSIRPKHPNRPSWLHLLFVPQQTMHSSLNRIQSVFGFFTTVALVVSALAAVSVLFFPADETNASVQLKNVQV